MNDWGVTKQWHKYLYPAIKSGDGVFEDLNDEDAGLGAAAGDPDAEVLAWLPLESHREEIFKRADGCSSSVLLNPFP